MSNTPNVKEFYGLFFKRLKQLGFVYKTHRSSWNKSRGVGSITIYSADLNSPKEAWALVKDCGFTRHGPINVTTGPTAIYRMEFTLDTLNQRIADLAFYAGADQSTQNSKVSEVLNRYFYYATNRLKFAKQDLHIVKGLTADGALSVASINRLHSIVRRIAPQVITAHQYCDIDHMAETIAGAFAIQFSLPAKNFISYVANLLALSELTLKQLNELLDESTADQRQKLLNDIYESEIVSIAESDTALSDAIKSAQTL